MFPGDRSLDRGGVHRCGADVFHLSRVLGHAAARAARDPRCGVHRRLRRRTPARARRGRPPRRPHRDGRRGRVEAGRRADRLDPRHRPLPAQETCLMREKVARPDLVRGWPGDFPVAHRYTPGVAGEAFLTALRDRGAVLGSRCERCAYTHVPARLFYERGFAELAADVELGPGGTLVSYTIGFAGVEGDPLDPPATLGLVRLAGADAGPL